MTDDAETQAEETAPAAPSFTAPASQEDFDRMVADRLSRERAKFRDYAELKEKASKFDEVAEAQKTESQRYAETAARAQREAEEARAETLRYRVAASRGVTADYFDLLGTGDEETLNGRAERLGSLLNVASENEHLKAELEALKTGKTPSRTRPVADLKPGATPNLDAFPDDTSYPASWLPQQRQSSN